MPSRDLHVFCFLGCAASAVTLCPCIWADSAKMTGRSDNSTDSSRDLVVRPGATVVSLVNLASDLSCAAVFSDVRSVTCTQSAVCIQHVIYNECVACSQHDTCMQHTARMQHGTHKLLHVSSLPPAHSIVYTPVHSMLRSMLHVASVSPSFSAFCDISTSQSALCTS